MPVCDKWRLTFECPYCPKQHQFIGDGGQIAAQVYELMQNGVVNMMVNTEAEAQLTDMELHDNGEYPDNLQPPITLRPGFIYGRKPE